MCTVMFLPSEDSLLFCSVRDESPTRAQTFLPQQRIENELTIISPIDGLKLGTWCGTNSLGTTIILLNGAETTHFPRKESYSKSRGLIVNELLSAENALEYWDNIDLSGIEPFTLVVYSNKKLIECSWNEINKQQQIRNAEIPHIWSSSTLYTPEQKKDREVRFQSWINENKKFTKESITTFLESHPDSENGFLMNRANIVRSISISIIVQTSHFVQFNYSDLLTKEKSQQDLYYA